MAKDKRKKKYFQGLPPQIIQPTTGSEVTEESTASFSYVKSDLWKLLLIGGFCVLIIGVLTFIDKRTDLLGNIAEKILSNIVK